MKVKGIIAILAIVGLLAFVAVSVLGGSKERIAATGTGLRTPKNGVQSPEGDRYSVSPPLGTKSVPQQINYQGYLANSSDSSAVTDTLEIGFAIYDQANGGNLLWSETHSQVPVIGGFFNLFLGSVNSLPDTIFTGQGLWLGTAIGRGVLLPRKKLASVPYSFRSSGGEGSGCWICSGNDCYFSKSGNVGIGTTSPEAKLEVNGTIKGHGGFGTGVWGTGLLCGVYGEGSVGISGKGYIGISAEADTSLSEEAIAGYFDGKVGIGTNSPNDKLEVVGGLRVDDYIRARDSGGLALKTDEGSTRLYVKDTGNIGLGTTNPKNRLDVEGAMVVGSTYSGSSTAPSNGMLVQGKVGIGTSSTGSHRLYVKSSGSGVSGATARIENDDPDGIGLSVDNTSSDLTLLLRQHGGGDILRCDSWTGGWDPVFKVENDGKIVCSVLQLTGGSDLSEQFDIKQDKVDAKPGMVVCIDPEHPGKLIVSKKAYDRKVAGVISGAGGIEPGMLMGQRGSKADGAHPVALTGRVYCWTDVSNGSIQPGDLLTTSATPGHAMKVTDYAQAQGAILGKAMNSLDQGQGLVLVLVSLQ